MTAAAIRLRVLPRLTPVDGRAAEFQTTATHVQWRLVGDDTWEDLVPLSDITGPAGANGANGADGADGTMTSVVAGTGVTVDSTDPANPEVAVDLIDDDTFATATSTNIPSAESVKALADTKVAGFASTTALGLATIPTAITQVLVKGNLYEEITSSYWNLGPELVVNGTMAADTDWTKGSGWAIASGVATKTAGASNSLSQTGTAQSGKYYFTSYDITALTAGNFRMALGGVFGTARSTVATFDEILGPTVNTNFVSVLATAATTAGSIDNVSVKLMPDDAVKSADGRWWGPVAQTFKGPFIQPFITLTDGATITPDLSKGNKFKVTLGGNRTLANPSNITEGQEWRVYVTQDGTGSRTLAFGTYYDWPGGVAPTLSTAAAAVDLLVFEAITSTRIVGNIVQDFG